MFYILGIYWLLSVGKSRPQNTSNSRMWTSMCPHTNICIQNINEFDMTRVILLHLFKSFLNKTWVIILVVLWFIIHFIKIGWVIYEYLRKGRCDSVIKWMLIHICFCKHSIFIKHLFIYHAVFELTIIIFPFHSHYHFWNCDMIHERV